MDAEVKEEMAAMPRELAVIEHEFNGILLEVLADELKKYNQNQPRVPAGNSDGGQWTSGGGSGGGSVKPAAKPKPVGKMPLASKPPKLGNKIPEDSSQQLVESARVMNDGKPVKKPKKLKKPKAEINKKLTVHSNMKITIHHDNGTNETRKGGSRSWRNNNPGNLRSGGFANRHGAIGNNNGFAVFSTEKDGTAASVALLKGPTYADLSVNQAVERRSPSNENDTERTQELVQSFSGLSGEEKLSDLDTDQFDKLVRAIARSEGWIEGTIKKVRKK